MSSIRPVGPVRTKIKFFQQRLVETPNEQQFQKVCYKI
jgi:hypothetical protein